ncbi:MAG TPA: GNAT family N-acetyltransferase [Longimicrobium sp.]|nr:GNAT family N-acetyltransferase [Longimicrobium sp.]
MKSETLLPPGVEVRRAAAEEQAIVMNLLQLYAHDFSEFIDLQLQPDGRFGDPDLSRYWREEGRFPFLVRVDGHLAGCVLVSRGSPIREDPRVWDMAEFFIVRRYRKRGIGAAVAHEIWRRLPGPWEVRVLESNRPARAFWGAAIRAFTPSMAEGRMMEVRENRWEVFSFVSPPPPAAE